MKKFGKLFVIVAGIIVVCAIFILFYAAAYMRSGHPPASGIVGLVVVFVVSPISVLASLIGLFMRERVAPLKDKIFYIMTGINLSFSIIVLFLFIFKVLLGKTI